MTIVRNLDRTLVLVVTDHDDVVTKNRGLNLGRLFIIIIVVIVGAGASTLPQTLLLPFDMAFSVLLVFLLPVCFIFHRVQFHILVTLSIGSIGGIAVLKDLPW
jgi:hypothetical protein